VQKYKRKQKKTVNRKNKSTIITNSIWEIGKKINKNKIKMGKTKESKASSTG